MSCLYVIYSKHFLIYTISYVQYDFRQSDRQLICLIVCIYFAKIKIRITELVNLFSWNTSQTLMKQLLLWVDYVVTQMSIVYICFTKFYLLGNLYNQEAIIYTTVFDSWRVERKLAKLCVGHI